MLRLFRPHSLKSRFLVLLTGFLVVFGVSSLIMSVLVAQSQNARAAAERQLTRNLDALVGLNRNLLAAADMADVARTDRVGLKRICTVVDWAFEDAQSVFTDPAMAEASGLLTSAQVEWDAIIAAVDKAPSADGAALEKEVADRLTNISYQVTQVYLLTRTRATQELDRVGRDTRAFTAGLAVMVAIALAAGAVTLLSLYGRILRPLDLLRDGAVLWHGGNLEHRLSMTSADEFGDLAHIMNEMVGHLNSLMLSLEDESSRDPLTGLLNRRAFDRTLGLELERAVRYRHPLALLMIDIDHFKLVNDRYGHVTGDHVLRVVAARVKACTRATDSVFRYGGEELAVILPETAADGAMQVAARICESVATPISGAGGRRPFAVTVSIGVTEAVDPALDSAGTVAAADAALYEAKHSGRNRVCLYHRSEHLPTGDVDSSLDA